MCFILWNKKQNKAPSLYQFQKLRRGQKPRRVLKCELCEKLNQRGKVLLLLYKETVHSQLQIIKGNRKINVTGLDEFDLCVVRSTVYDFYKTEKQASTTSALKKKLHELIGFNVSLHSLKSILKSMGFRWSRMKSNRKLLVEKNYVRVKHNSFLTDISHFRQEGICIIYMDESYILSSHTVGKSWSDDSSEGLHCLVPKGERLIMIHLGEENCFVENALLMSKANSSTGDYHSQMNFENYEKWLREKLIPKLPTNSVVVIDNGPYHNVLLQRTPNSNSRKLDMMNWLASHGIPCSDDMFKPQLYRLIKIHKPRTQKYLVDHILSSYGHNVIRLPPYHPDLNLIQMIRSQVKQWVATRNVIFKTEDVKLWCEQKFSEMGEREWRPVCDNVKRREKEYLETREVDRLTISLGGSASDSSYSSDMEVEDDTESDDQLSRN
jgi:transposase